MTTAASEVKTVKTSKGNTPFTIKNLPWGIIRVVTILLLAGIVVWQTVPYGQGFIDEARSSKAASKGRVLQRGAQIVATQRMIQGDSADAAAAYLATPEALPEILEAAAFPVTALEIKEAELDTRGLLSHFSCVVESEERRYTVAFDIADYSGTVSFLEDAPKEEKK
ncbi:MAG: hypothetical protein RSF82_06735 [Angelakisella sp.]